MKNIIFIDNDNLDKAQKTIDDFVLPLLNKGKLIVDKSNISIIPNFSNRNIEDNYKLLFDPNNVIITWSMFTSGGSVSLQQLKRYMTGAGMYDKSGLIYIDTAGYLTKTCEGIINDSTQKNIQYFMKGIDNNYIISNYYDGCFRLKIDFNLKHFIRRDEIDLSFI